MYNVLLQWISFGKVKVRAGDEEYPWKRWMVSKRYREEKMIMNRIFILTVVLACLFSCGKAAPNMEIRSIFTDQILSMFREQAGSDGRLLQKFCSALEEGNAPEVERLLLIYLGKTLSIRDTFVRKPSKENFYHGILLGILGYKDGWILKSNRESGNGYSDISIRIDDKDMGIIIEVKYAESRQLEAVCRDALAQIERNGYADELRREGCHTILKYGIACCRKECRVMVDTEKAKE